MPARPTSGSGEHFANWTNIQLALIAGVAVFGLGNWLYSGRPQVRLLAGVVVAAFWAAVFGWRDQLLTLRGPTRWGMLAKLLGVALLFVLLSLTQSC